MNNKFKLSALASAVTLTLAACGGGTGGAGDIAGIGGSGYISSGTVTGFGSVYVNGIKYETDDTAFDVEGNTAATQGNLAIGMVVRVEGTVNPDGITGTATRIVFDDDLQGPVSNLVEIDVDTKTFSILGVTVKVDRRRTEFDDKDALGFNFDTLANDLKVEVSGFFDATGVLNATYIDRDDDLNEVKIQGEITGLSGTTFYINDKEIDASTAQLDDDLIETPLADGLRVKLEGTTDGGVIVAKEIELLENDYSDDDEIDIEGFITDFIDNNHFTVNGITVDASNVNFSSDYVTLGNDTWIEVEGTYANGVLVANEIELRDGDLEINAVVDQVNTDGSFSVIVGGQTINVQTGYETEFDYEDGLTQLISGQFVEIDGYQIDDNTLFALEVDVQSASDDEQELQGIYLGTSLNEDTIKILNVEFTVDGNTDFGDLIDMNGFLASAVVGETLVKVEYDTNGVATKVETEEEDD